MERLKIKIINRSGHELPSYGTFEAAGMDVRAFLPAGPLTLKPFERALIQTGLYMELPAGYECQIRPRSGLALKHGLTINDGDRICQMVVKQYCKVEWESVSELDRTKREDGAFGHTGTN